MNAFFTHLGTLVAERWKKENFSLEQFPALACAALAELPPSEQVDLPALVRDFLLNDRQPHQSQSGFGQPELVVFDDPRFYIQILFWLDGTTAIHQHEFSGAFHVMSGSSIHAEYEFENARSITPHFRVGNVRMKSLELLETGRTVPIVSGRSCIHSLFHLETPSVTVVVRTQHDPGTGPQFNYLPPHLAVDPELSDTLTTRRKQLLEVLEQTNDAGYVDLVLELLQDLDLERAFYILQHCTGTLDQLGALEAGLEVFAAKHGDVTAEIVATLQEDARREVIKELRSSISEPGHRFFLALLMNVPDRARTLALVAQRHPESPAEDTILRWAAELMDVTDSGISLLDAAFPEGLEMELEEQADCMLAALRSYLVDETKAAARGKSRRRSPSQPVTYPPAILNIIHGVFSQSCLRVLGTP